MLNQVSADLPNPFRFADGTLVCSPADWQRRRKEISVLIVELEYGGLPPTPTSTIAEELHHADISALGDAQYITYRVQTGPDHPFSFSMTLLIPPGDGPFPVVLTGDGCWRYANDSIAAEVLRRGMILAQFNRVEIVPDAYSLERTSGLYRVYPEGTYGALAAWAWGYHRCVDVLVKMPVVDAGRIAVVGHSRGGKTVLLAGATDERIALTSPNDSGCGGAGSFYQQGPNCEKLSDILTAFPYWFGPRLQDYIGKETTLPFDQHFLHALIAPRVLLTTEALGDLWANPSGSWQVHLAAREVYRFLAAEDRLGIWYRPGVHDHGWQDWNAFLDFMQWQLCGRPRPVGFNENPFPELPRAFSWSAPVCGEE